MGHSKISPSGSPRWMECLGSPTLEARYPDTSSPYAQEGTDAHRVMEKALINKIPPIQTVSSEVLHEDGTMFVVTQEMAEYVQLCYDWLMTRSAELEAHVTPERKVSCTKIHAELHGTTDAVIAQKFGTLVVYDLKYGQGVKVSPFRNPQLMIYALGVLDVVPDPGMFEQVELVIHQPRIDPEPQVWQITPQELVEWGQSVLKPAATKAAKFSTILKAGEWCHFCKANAECPKLAQQAQAEAASIFAVEPMAPVPAEQLTPADISRILTSMPVFDIWRKALEEKAYARAERDELPGFKLVEGRSNRKWRNEDTAEQICFVALKEKAFSKPSLLSVAQMEKAIKAAGAKDIDLSVLIEKPAGKPTLVQNSDPRLKLCLDKATDVFTNKEWLL